MALVEQLMSMGFSENGCKRAALATSNADAETAMGWIFEHMEDPDFNNPPEDPATSGATSGAASGGGGAAADPEAVMMLTSMGYTEQQVGAALRATDNNIERYGCFEPSVTLCCSIIVLMRCFACTNIAWILFSYLVQGRRLAVFTCR
jgi:uncharacterized UBP type Zn finger protein